MRATSVSTQNPNCSTQSDTCRPNSLSVLLALKSSRTQISRDHPLWMTIPSSSSTTTTTTALSTSLSPAQNSHPSMAKRPCFSLSSQNPSLSSSMDDLLAAFLDMADSPSLSFDLSFERLLDSLPCDADQSLLIDRAHNLGSLLLQTAKNSARRRASKHNSLAWVLPPDLTIKVRPHHLSFVVLSLCTDYFSETQLIPRFSQCLILQACVMLLPRVRCSTSAQWILSAMLTLT